MGFLSGKVSILRFRVEGGSPRAFTEEHLDQLRSFAAGMPRVRGKHLQHVKDLGWTAGEDVLDTRFKQQKNIASDMMLFAFRHDTNKLPTDLLRAYESQELANLTEKKGDEGLRKRAKETARERMEKQAADGRFIKYKTIPVYWDRLSNEVLFAASSPLHAFEFCQLFHETFGAPLDVIASGTHAFHLAEVHGLTRQADDSVLSKFVPDSPAEVAWIDRTDEHVRDFLGNEFLLWLWYRTRSGSITLSDKSEAWVLLARSMLLECARGMHGHVVIAHEQPATRGESLVAARTGKLPRQAGLTINRNSEQFDFALTAETLAIGGLRLPLKFTDEPLSDAQILEERIAKLRRFLESFDLLFDAFIRVRFGRQWEKELAGMQKWLQA